MADNDIKQSTPSTSSDDEWLRQYDELAERFNALYEKGTERGFETMLQALDKAKEELVNAKQMSLERGEQLRRFLERDLREMVQAAEEKGEDLLQKTAADPTKAGALASLATALELAGKALLGMSKKMRDPLTYHTGEITSAGTLVCKQCGEKLHFDKTARIPPCPKCKGTEFVKTL